MSDPIAALDAIGQLPDSEIDIAEAALQLARIDLPDADERAARQHLSEIAQQAVAAGREIGPHDIAGQADVLAQLIGGQFGYHGDPARYEEPDNANLLRVSPLSEDTHQPRLMFTCKRYRQLDPRCGALALIQVNHQVLQRHDHQLP